MSPKKHALRWSRMVCAGLFAMVAVGASLAAVGCGGNVVVDGGTTKSAETACVAVCEAFAGCPGGDPGTDCGQPCVDFAAQAKAAGCESEAAIYFSCLAATADVCSGGLEGCESEIIGYGNCINASCEEDPDTCQGG